MTMAMIGELAKSNDFSQLIEMEMDCQGHYPKCRKTPLSRVKMILLIEGNLAKVRLHPEINEDSPLLQLNRILRQSIEVYYVYHEMSNRFMSIVEKDLFVHSSNSI